MSIERNATQSRIHAIERTSPKGPGQKFVGTCRLCGTTGLTFANMGDECPNQRGLSTEEALIEAISVQISDQKSEHETPNDAETVAGYGGR